MKMRYGRPEAGRCLECREVIYGKTSIATADVHYVFPDGEMVCEYCVPAWAEKFKIRDKRGDVECYVCHEDKWRGVVYDIHGEIICGGCLMEWAHDFKEGGWW